MEGLVLQSLDFRVNAPTCFTFYSVLLRHLQPSPKTAALASYILVHPSQRKALSCQPASDRLASKTVCRWLPLVGGA